MRSGFDAFVAFPAPNRYPLRRKCSRGSRQRKDRIESLEELAVLVWGMGCFAPVSALVVIDEPQGSYHGGDIAAPVFREIAEQVLPELNITPDTEVKSAPPMIAQLSKAMEGHFVVEDWHNFGADYDPTLMAWNENFETAWPELRDKYGERFRRMWRYYLLQSAGAFRARYMQLWQLVVSPHGVPGGYVSVR